MSIPNSRSRGDVFSPARPGAGLRLACLAAALSLAPAGTIAQEGPRAADGEFQPGEREAADPAEDLRERARRERLVATGVLAIVGIALLGGMLVIVTILWGGSLRKRVRAAPPAQSAGDELWYLRKKTPPATGGARPDSPDDRDGERAGSS